MAGKAQDHPDRRSDHQKEVEVGIGHLLQKRVPLPFGTGQRKRLLNVATRVRAVICLSSPTIETTTFRFSIMNTMLEVAFSRIPAATCTAGTGTRL